MVVTLNSPFSWSVFSNIFGPLPLAPAPAYRATATGFCGLAFGASAWTPVARTAASRRTVSSRRVIGTSRREAGTVGHQIEPGHEATVPLCGSPATLFL